MTDFPGGPGVKTSLSNARDVGSIPGWGARIPHAFRPENQTQNIKRKPYCNKFHKDLKMVHIKTIFKKKKDDEAGKANRVTGVNRKKPNRVLLQHL